MNDTNMSQAGLMRSMTEKLEALLGEVKWLRGWRVEPETPPAVVGGSNLLVTLPLPGKGKAVLCVACKRDVRPGLFPLLLARQTTAPAGRGKVVVPVLAVPWMSPRMAELCAEAGWSWFDLAGNHQLDVPGVLHLQHTGNPPVQKRPRPTANLGTPEAARVMRALLAPENAAAAWTQREMQRQCWPDVSLGLVNKVVRHLRDEAFLDGHHDGGFRLRDPVSCLLAWRVAYRLNRHARRGYFTLLQGNKLRDALAGFGTQAGGLAAYAAFSAAERQAPHVRQPKTWLYIREQELSGFEAAIEAKPVESGENLVVLVPEDDGVFYLRDRDGKQMPCTNAVQTYVDLFHCGGRGEEAAGALLEQILKPVWKRNGLKV